jgi:acyl-CoA synthetase (AMP-forming)/AMP-acid ligase II
VKEAASAGIPDRYYGERIRAFVVLRAGARATAEDLVVHCQANLARYKVPSRIFIVDALPRTTIGKIDRIVLRQELSAE